MKRGTIEQRWSSSSSGGLTNPAHRSTRRDFISCRRLAVECLVFALLVSWLVGMCFLLADTYTDCAASSSSRGLSYVNIRAWAGSLYWTVGRNSEVGVAHGRPRNSTWRVEEQHDGWFCLRHVADLRVMEAIPNNGKPEAMSLRLGRFGCDSETQHFKFQGKSMYNKAVGSFINMREIRLLRTHGDSPPWQPLRRETRGTRLIVEEASDTARLAADVEKRLLTLLARLERGTAPPAATPPPPARAASKAGKPGRRLNSTASEL
mmetsp:Transcript_2257/g.7130  ORF Transcript_2257/g.7130 Transcript_2257/m.7130 type:complete len:263 (-) Transcript_2257:340-1128(-)